MKSNYITLIVFILGVAVGISLSFFWEKEGAFFNENSYIKLEDDFCIDNIGFLRKGTLIKFDKAFSEGFSRYILYLNFPSSHSGSPYVTEHEHEIIPYWLRQRDSTCISNH